MSDLTSRLKEKAKRYLTLSSLVLPLATTNLNSQKLIYLNQNEMKLVYAKFGEVVKEGINPIYNKEGNPIEEKFYPYQDSTFVGTKRYFYDERGNLIKEEYHGSNKLSRSREYFYTNKNVLIKINYDHNGDGVIDAIYYGKGSKK